MASSAHQLQHLPQEQALIGRWQDLVPVLPLKEIFSYYPPKYVQFCLMQTLLVISTLHIQSA
jgi:hypothetical protein